MPRSTLSAAAPHAAEPIEGVNVLAGTPDLEEEEAAPVRLKPGDPGYDATLDPESPRWDAKKYFGLQPKEIIVVMRTESDILTDPQGKQKQTIPASINGYTLTITKGVPTRVPRDFATFLVESGAAVPYGSIPEAVEA